LELAAVAVAVVVAAAAARNGDKFQSVKMEWGSFPWIRGSGCQKFDSDWCLFPLDGGMRKKERKLKKKKITMGKEGLGNKN
jgi:hypothetical protein